jgi:hypothetical protein
VNKTDEVTEAEQALEAAEAKRSQINEGVLDGNATAAEQIDVEEEVKHRYSILSRARDNRTAREAREAELARQAKLAAIDQLITERFGSHEAGIVERFDALVRCSPSSSLR